MHDKLWPCNSLHDFYMSFPGKTLGSNHLLLAMILTNTNELLGKGFCLFYDFYHVLKKL